MLRIYINLQWIASQWLRNQSDDPRQKRLLLPTAWQTPSIISSPTSWKQPSSELYTLIEEGAFGASKLNSIMKKSWQISGEMLLEIDDDAALLVRQTHYYMGLYGYTYSAGLVISAAGYLHLKHSEAR